MLLEKVINNNRLCKKGLRNVAITKKEWIKFERIF